MKSAKHLTLVALACAAFVSGNAVADAIEARDAWLPAYGERVRVAPVFMTLVNHADSADRLIAVRTDIARDASVQTMALVDGELRQQRLRSVELPAGVPVSLHAGGAYVVLDGIDAPLQPRAAHTLHLVFEKAGEREVRVRVRPAARDGTALENLRTDPLQQPGQLPRTEGLDDVRTDPFLR